MSLKKTCSICLEEYNLVAYAKCRHFMCITCCWTLRDIADDFKCPICRFELPWVVLSKYPFPEYENEDELKAMIADSNKVPIPFLKINSINLYGLKHDLVDATNIRAPQCTQCKISFDDVHLMSKHLISEHKLRFCYVCIEYLKKLPKDYELYRSSELSEHLRTHPKCTLCDKYVLNENTLRSHRKTNHFQCDVCDQAQKVSVFNSHIELTDHFQSYHFLCEYGECARFHLTVFASKIEYHRHLANHHSSLFTKEQRKNLLNFSNNDYIQYSQPNNAAISNPHSTRTSNTRENRNVIDVVNEMRVAEDQTSNLRSLILNDDNFPHLSVSSRRIEADLPLINHSNRPLDNLLNGSLCSRNTYPTIQQSTNDEFPSLSSSDVQPNANSQKKDTLLLPTTTSMKKSIDKSLPQNPQEDFPSFPTSNDTTFPGQSNVWDKAPRGSSVKKFKYQQTTPVVHAPPINTLAYSLGLRNLDITVKDDTRQKKKKKKKSHSTTIANINVDVNEDFPALNPVTPAQTIQHDNTQKNADVCTTKNDLDLFDMVKAACDYNDITLANFMQLCANFARGRLNATEFYNNITEIVGYEQFHNIIPKLADELPDESKRKTLLNLLNKNSTNPTSKSNTSKKKDQKN